MPKNKITETQKIISFHLVSEETGAGFPGGSVEKNPPANAGIPVRSLIQEDSTLPWND